MATGEVEPVMTAIPLAGLSTNVELAPLPQDARGLLHADSIFEGTILSINAAPISQDYGGEIGFSFVDDFYFRVYLIPSALDFGAIVTTSIRDIQVWNAYFEPVTLQSIVPQFGTEITNEGDATPFVIGPLLLHSWPFKVTPEGPPTLEDTLTFTFSTGEIFNVEVTGQRSVLWPFLPNWRESVKLTRTYNTGIFSARSGREQRTAFRKYPRKQMEFTVTLNDARRARFRQLMSFWQDRPFIVADVTRNSTTTGAMSAGASSVTVDNPAAWMVEDRAVVLVSGSGNLEVIGLRVIDDVTSGGTITFKDTDEIDWPIGTLIYAGAVANLTDETQGRRMTTMAVEAPVQFNILPGSEGAIDPPAAPTLFNGKELFMHKPNWAEETGDLNRHITEYVDYDIGRIQRTSPVGYSTQVWSGTYLGRDADTITELLDIFDRAKGQQGELYAPTWERDLFPKSDLTHATSEMRVAGLDILTAYANDLPTAGVMLMMKDGSTVLRAIDTMEEINDTEGDDTKITFLTAWDTDISLDDIDYVSWIKCWRFSTDDLTAEFLTNSVANIVMSMQTIEDLPPDTDEDSNSA